MGSNEKLKNLIEEIIRKQTLAGKFDSGHFEEKQKLGALKEIDGVFKNIVEAEIDRAYDVLGEVVAGRTRPKIYWDEVLFYWIAGYYNIANGDIFLNSEYKEEKSGWTFNGFITSLRHELAHWAVNEEHGHSNYKFSEYLERLGGAAVAGGKPHKRTRYERLLNLLAIDVFGFLKTSKGYISNRKTYLGGMYTYITLGSSKLAIFSPFIIWFGFVILSSFLLPFGLRMFWQVIFFLLFFIVSKDMYDKNLIT